MLEFVRATRDLREAVSNTGQQLEVATDLVIEHGDVARRLIGYGDVIAVVMQLRQRSPHRDHIVIGMRRKHDDAPTLGSFARPRIFAIRVLKTKPFNGSAVPCRARSALRWWSR